MRYLLRSTALLVAISTGVNAEVTDRSAAGFSTRHQVEIALQPGELYDLMIRDIGQWWNPSHSYTGKGENLRIDAFAGGCFCERLENGSMEHMRVIYVDRGKLLRMMGGLGPLQTIAASGPLDWKIDASETGSTLTVTYHVSGYLKEGLQTWAEPVDGVIGEQVKRLQQHANGSRNGVE